MKFSVFLSILFSIFTVSFSGTQAFGGTPHSDKNLKCSNPGGFVQFTHDSTNNQSIFERLHRPDKSTNPQHSTFFGNIGFADDNFHFEKRFRYTTDGEFQVNSSRIVSKHPSNPALAFWEFMLVPNPGEDFLYLGDKKEYSLKVFCEDQDIKHLPIQLPKIQNPIHHMTDIRCSSADGLIQYSHYTVPIATTEKQLFKVSVNSDSVSKTGTHGIAFELFPVDITTPAVDGGTAVGDYQDNTYRTAGIMMSHKSHVYEFPGGCSAVVDFSIKTIDSKPFTTDNKKYLNPADASELIVPMVCERQNVMNLADCGD